MFIRGASQTLSLVLILKQTKKQIFSPLYRHGDWGRWCPLLHPIPLESPLCHLSVCSSQFSSPLNPLFLCTFWFFVFFFFSFFCLESCSPLSAKHHSFFSIWFHMFSGNFPDLFSLPPPLIPSFPSLLTFKTLAVIIYMFYLLLLHSMFISAHRFSQLWVNDNSFELASNKTNKKWGGMFL